MTTRRDDDPLDTYLLRVFCLLITERSVSRVALGLNQSQPCFSGLWNGDRYAVCYCQRFER